MQTQRWPWWRLLSTNRRTIAPASAVVWPCRSRRSETGYSPRFSFLISRRSMPGAAKSPSDSSRRAGRPVRGFSAAGRATGRRSLYPPARIAWKREHVRHLARKRVGVGCVVSGRCAGRGLLPHALHRTIVRPRLSPLHAPARRRRESPQWNATGDLRLRADLPAKAHDFTPAWQVLRNSYSRHARLSLR